MGGTGAALCDRLYTTPMPTRTCRAIAALERESARSADAHLIRLNPMSALANLQRMAYIVAQ